jgi:two-component sensor histidine kinase
MQIDRALLTASWRSWVSNDNRPRVGPAWLQWMWTLLFCAALAVPFTVLGFVAFASGNAAWRNWAGWLQWYGKNLVVCLCIGVVIHLLFDLTRRWFATPQALVKWRPWQRTAYFSGLPLLGVALGWPLGVRLAGTDVVVWIGSRDGNNLVVGSILLALMLTFLFHHFFSAKTRQLDAERRASQAQLRLLQGQIEPHFLFNTLANVSALMDHDTPRAKQMLESFTDYLRCSLSGLRHEQASLGSEVELVQHYLSLLQSRMEERLQFSISVPEDLREYRLPPLMLQPLVENAIHHGLEPKVEGGHVHVSARREDTWLVLEVADDGLGPAAAPRPVRGARHGTGMALNNLRERLQAQFGEQASLHLAPNSPGTLATLRIPLQSQPLP